MMKKFGKHLPFMNIFPKLSRASRKSLLQKDASNELVDAVCEICLNVIKSNVCMTEAQKIRLSRYKNIIRTLGSKNKSPAHRKRKRNILVQKGGSFLPLLFTLVTPFITRLLGTT